MPVARSGVVAIAVSLLLGSAALVLPMKKASAQNNAGKSSGTKLFYVGTYSSADKPGIYAFRLDDATGSLTPAGTTSGIENPSYIALAPGKTRLYAVSETGAGEIFSYKADATTGALTFLNKQPSKGSYPCHLAVDKTGKMLILANYGNGIVTSYSLDNEGKISDPVSVIQQKGVGPNLSRQEGPHAHFTGFDAAGTHAFACDLGADKVFIYSASPLAGTLTPSNPPSGSVPAGSGPRHLVFDPAGKFAYVLNEMTATVSVLRYDPLTGFTARQLVSCLPDSFTGANTGAEIVMHPGGRLLFASNRGHDSIAVFAISRVNGQLTPKGHIKVGKTPRGFALDPDGRWMVVAGQDDDTLRVYKIDAAALKVIPTEITATVPKPVSVLFAP